MKADNGIQQPPICPRCYKRCGRFLCPCCGDHAPFPWKCEACTPHSSPCMSQLARPGDARIGCLIVLVSIAIAVLFVLLIIQEVTS